MQRVLIPVIAMMGCTAALPLTVDGQSLRSGDFVMERAVVLCRSDVELESTGIRVMAQPGSVAETSCAAAAASDLRPPGNAEAGAALIEPRYPLLGTAVGAAAGAVVGAMMMSTADYYMAWYHPVFTIPAGALTGLVLGLYIGAKADD